MKNVKKKKESPSIRADFKNPRHQSFGSHLEEKWQIKCI
jgi:hypothetical protein